MLWRKPTPAVLSHKGRTTEKAVSNCHIVTKRTAGNRVPRGAPPAPRGGGGTGWGAEREARNRDGAGYVHVKRRARLRRPGDIQRVLRSRRLLVGPGLVAYARPGSAGGRLRVAVAISRNVK